MQENLFKGEMESNRQIGLLDKMNIKDRKILYELSKNARFSISTISKKVGLSRDIVSYRLNNMMKSRLVPGFTLFVNTSRLGFLKHIIYLKLQHLGKEEETKLVDRFVKEKDIVWVATCSGNWDMGVIILSRNLLHFNETFNKVLEICSNNLKDYTIETEVEDKSLGLGFLVEGINVKETEKYLKDGFVKELNNPSPSENLKVDATDIALLNILMENSRMPLSDICAKLRLSAPAVENRIKTLIREEIIYGFMGQISIQMLGLQWHWILLRTRNLTKEREKQLKHFLKKHPYFTWLVKTVGKWNFQLSVFAKDAIHFREILSEFRKEFEDIIADYDSIMIFNQYKYMHKIELCP